MSMDDTLSSLRTRPTLLFRLREWTDEASWAEFYRLYYNYIFSFARRHGLSHADAEEMARDIFAHVAAALPEFESDPQRGNFRDWLLWLARRHLGDWMGTHPPPDRAASPGDATGTTERVPDEAELTALWNTEWQRHVLDTALTRLARRVPTKQFQIFDLHVRQNWPVLRVARELGVHPASVYLIRHRLTWLLKAEMAELQEKLA